MPSPRRPEPPHRRAFGAAAALVLALTSCTTTAPAAPARVTPTSSSSPTLRPTSPGATLTTTTDRPTPAASGPTSGPASSTKPKPLATPLSGHCVAGYCYEVGPVHELRTGVAPESSGIAASAKSPGTFFVVDDGTGADQIVAVRSTGSLVAEVAVAGMSADNAEALAAGPCGDRAGRCLYIGDIGDNAAQRDHVTIYRISEPSLSPAPTQPVPVPADQWDYAYPDGPHNSEALMVGNDGSLIVITKSAIDKSTGKVPPHRIYRAAPGGGDLRFVSSFTPPAPARRLQSLFTGTVVTDANYAKGRVLLLTYDQVVEYLAPSATADPAKFPTWPHHELPAPPMIQSEGITADVAGCGYEVASEEGPGGTRAGLAGVACR